VVSGVGVQGSELLYDHACACDPAASQTLNPFDEEPDAEFEFEDVWDMLNPNPFDEEPNAEFEFDDEDEHDWDRLNPDP